MRAFRSLMPSASEGRAGELVDVAIEDVVRLCQRHRLHDDRRTPADRDVSYSDLALAGHAMSVVEATETPARLGSGLPRDLSEGQSSRAQPALSAAFSRLRLSGGHRASVS